MIKRLAILPVFLLSIMFLHAQSLERIGAAIQGGNSKELAKYFEKTVEITIYEDEQVYSKAQAELVLKDFFNKHLPSSFKVIHKGNSNQGSQYGIGTLMTEKGAFRTYIYVKQKDDVHYIQEIRFESD